MSDTTCDEPLERGALLGSNGAAGHPADGEAGLSSADPELAAHLRELLDDLQAAASLQPGQLVVVGASSSEVIGQRIGTATSRAVGEVIVDTILDWARGLCVEVAFQCCEHLNRSLVVERSSAMARSLQEVFAIPVPGAGGAVASVAYFRMKDACLVAEVRADAGIDIGDTLIGMHLKRVAVPVRGRYQALGAAHVTMARTRPPLVGGTRAVYDVAEAKRRIQGSAR
ncbi:TIGR01440 family protein [Alicyclobacillus fastidiosus]|uniref:UPF0340 protein NZD89_27215 n=1 Tax=Alicyclobacillus fastidiosus TaxID=392011 RepID=A0ABY6ZG83_9BACL|nr:TIGR01440 family protein [Alicyclobacillus fastidiosus]WAH41847.1 TIGR01440 family protein [Alicyclobacillus fastidiosus]GMA63551.1 UPF0340 protein [Alicyclobacillus fastidiosus]